MDFFTLLYIVISLIIVSAISLIGILLLKIQNTHKITLVLVSFATGALFGDAFFHLIPESIEDINNILLVSMLILAGFLLFFIMEKFLRWRHCHSHDKKHMKLHVGTLNLIGDFIHNFFDGLAIAVSYLISVPIGIATTIAVIMHEIPQELGDFGILLYSGFSKEKALKLNFLVSLSAFLGALVGLLIYQDIKLVYFLPVIAGGFIYIAGSDLIPELHETITLKESALQFIFIVFGLLLMFALKIYGGG
ncbi:MAG: ZIP family metal transporter [Candidatus Anstonellales archaeon]